MRIYSSPPVLFPLYFTTFYPPLKVIVEAVAQFPDGDNGEVSRPPLSLPPFRSRGFEGRLRKFLTRRIKIGYLGSRTLPGKLAGQRLILQSRGELLFRYIRTCGVEVDREKGRRVCFSDERSPNRDHGGNDSSHGRLHEREDARRIINRRVRRVAVATDRVNATGFVISSICEFLSITRSLSVR